MLQYIFGESVKKGPCLFSIDLFTHYIKASLKQRCEHWAVLNHTENSYGEKCFHEV